ncbi:hypothetical protein CTI12_AA624410 [Artemisia annua]|uniref:FH2 domain-containing protein n=1 Tax=Artemisia annua TaxID=35608 RepID=A0A2U1KAU5_ARTAN|nr:hypothetical protein CTI12_AA624410 [Artemisia annua]
MAAAAPRKSNLKPSYWSMVTRPLQGSFWEELQRPGESQSAQYCDVLELETPFSAVVQRGGRHASTSPETEKMHLVDLRRANNTEIMLTKVKMTLPEMMAAALAMDESILDADQVEYLIKLCPTKEEMELLKIRTSSKLKEIFNTILYLGHMLNYGTARGAAIGFKLDTLLKLTDTRASNSKIYDFNALSLQSTCHSS